MPSAGPATTLLTHIQHPWVTETSAQLLDLGPLGCEPVSTWQQRVHTSTGAAQDVLLSALLSEAHGGEVIAEELLLQALVPAVRRAAASLRSLDEHAPHDRTGVVVAAAWEAIRCYRSDRDTHVFITLLRDARRVLAPVPTANQRHIADKTTPVDTADLEQLAGAHPEPIIPAEIRLAEVLTWARDTRILTPTEIDLLTRATLGDEPAADIAASVGTTITGLRKRVQRTRARLTAALQAHP